MAEGLVDVVVEAGVEGRGVRMMGAFRPPAREEADRASGKLSPEATTTVSLWRGNAVETIRPMVW